MLIEIFWRGCQNHAAGRQSSYGHRLIADGADPQSHVPALLEEVDHAVVEADVDAQPRVDTKELGQDRHEFPNPEGYRRAQTQRSCHLEPFSGCDGIRFGEIGQDPLDADEITPARLSQRHLASGAV